MRTLCIDYGTKTMGIAVSDQLGLMGHGIASISRKSINQDIEQINAFIKEYEVKKIVIGLPKNMDGSLGPSAREVLGFVELLNKRLAVPVETWDERLSTMAAEKVLLEADLSRRKRKKVIDKVAAAVILQNYLDYSNTEHRVCNP